MWKRAAFTSLYCSKWHRRRGELRREPYQTWLVVPLRLMARARGTRPLEGTGHETRRETGRVINRECETYGSSSLSSFLSFRPAGVNVTRTHHPVVGVLQHRAGSLLGHAPRSWPPSRLRLFLCEIYDVINCTN